MRTLYLHVGMHKTGTTSIQMTLDSHREVLQAAGYSWFADEEPNHSRTLFSAFTGKPHVYHLNRRRGLHDPDAAEAHAAASRERLAAFLRDAPGPNLILSGEDMGMLRPVPVRRLLGAFRRHVDRIVVVGMVRPPRSFLASVIQERIRGGQTIEQIEAKPVQPQYRRRFETFLTAPEVAEARLQPYVPEALREGCSVATFLAMIDASDSLYRQLSVVRANATPSRLAVVLSLAANETVPVFLPDGRANPSRAERLRRFLDALPGERFVTPERLIGPGLRDAAEDIAWMEEQLGSPFAAAETEQAPPGAEQPDPHRLDWPEICNLAAAVNRLMRERAEARARGNAAAGRDLTPDRRALREARRGERQAARLNGRPRHGNAP